MRLIISLGLVILLMISCSSEDPSKEKDLEQKTLTTLEEEIIALTESSVCTDETECAYIAFGSKPCGGPWSYLVYSNSINTNELIAKVDRFNQMEHAHNIKYGIMSDCSIVNPPIELICEGGKCKAVYPQIQQQK